MSARVWRLRRLNKIHRRYRRERWAAVLEALAWAEKLAADRATKEGT